MHGVRRGSRLRGRAAAEAEERARVHATALRRALATRESPDRDKAWTLIASAVEANPDEYSLWAWRRDELLRLDDAALAERWTSELVLTQRALRRHPKAYAAWAHRLWLLGCERAPSRARADALAAEHALSGFMLARDGRNFHGWAHRLRVRALLHGDDEGSDAKANAKANAKADAKANADELDFVTARINTDFANYSAWHARSALLPAVRARERPGALADELEFVRQAFYTEPDVQSTWFYHRWLLAGMPDARGGRVAVDDVLWEHELSACDELLSIEPDARWVLHAKAHMLAHLRRRVEAAAVFERLMLIVRFVHIVSACETRPVYISLTTGYAAAAGSDATRFL